MATLREMVELARKQSDERYLHFKRPSDEEPWHINSWGKLDHPHEYALSADDLLADDWGIAEPERGCVPEAYKLFLELGAEPQKIRAS